MQLRDGTCGSFRSAGLLRGLWELDPGPACPPSHMLLGRGRAGGAGASGTVVPPCHPLSGVWLTNCPEACSPALPQPWEVGRAGRGPLTPSSLSAVHCVDVFALLLKMLCPEHAERSEGETHLGVLPAWRSAGRRGLPYSSSPVHGRGHRWSGGAPSVQLPGFPPDDRATAGCGYDACCSVRAANT